jgi:cytochrome c oxidase cbb3-type subunit 3
MFVATRQGLCKRLLVVSPFLVSLFGVSLMTALANISPAAAQSAKAATAKKAVGQVSSPAARGKLAFARDCAFCHGKDAQGGESGPDLTRSRLIARDVRGDRIRAVVQNGRPDKGMPPFAKFSLPEINDLIAFIRDQTKRAVAKPGWRRGVDVADLQTGNVDAGKAYFNGAGNCSSCHSATGDLAGIATRHEGLELEMRMLYPEGAKSKVTVTTKSGETITGTLAHKDEFTIAMKDPDGWHRSWPISDVQYKIDAPAEAHAEQLDKYTDDDIHNLMAYLQSLK